MNSETLWAARRVIESWLENASAGEDTAPEEKALAEIIELLGE